MGGRGLFRLWRSGRGLSIGQRHQARGKNDCEGRCKWADDDEAKQTAKISAWIPNTRQVNSHRDTEHIGDDRENEYNETVRKPANICRSGSVEEDRTGQCGREREERKQQKNQEQPVAHERVRREATSAISHTSKSAAPYADGAKDGNPTEGGSKVLLSRRRSQGSVMEMEDSP